MKRLGITLALSFVAFIVGFLFVVTLVYGCCWFVFNWDSSHAPRESPSGPHPAGAYFFLWAEMFVGLPGGVLTGLGGAFIVLVWRLARPRPAETPSPLEAAGFPPVPPTKEMNV
jgi:uncharacterized membrane protein YfcA